jgi:hypothetical protein
MSSDLQAAAKEIAGARAAEHPLTERHGDLPSLSARHHDAPTQPENSPKCPRPSGPRAADDPRKRDTPMPETAPPPPEGAITARALTAADLRRTDTAHPPTWSDERWAQRAEACA